MKQVKSLKKIEFDYELYSKSSRYGILKKQKLVVDLHQKYKMRLMPFLR